MFLRRQQGIVRKFIKGSDGYINIRRESYHSFPDPNENAQITKSTSDYKKTIDKNVSEGYSVNSKFRLDVPFPGVPASTGIHIQDKPSTFHTKLSNGLTVASQDSFGLMSSFAFLAQTGR